MGDDTHMRPVMAVVTQLNLELRDVTKFGDVEPSFVPGLVEATLRELRGGRETTRFYWPDNAPTIGATIETGYYVVAED